MLSCLMIFFVKGGEGVDGAIGPFSAGALVILLIFSYIPAKIAEKKGYSFAFFYVFGIFFFPVALATSLVKPNKNKKHTFGDVETIEKYEQMLERGEITYKEFTAKKKELEK